MKILKDHASSPIHTAHAAAAPKAKVTKPAADHHAKAGHGAAVDVSGMHAKASTSVGRSSVGAKPKKPVVKLSHEQLAAITHVGGVGIKGFGTLHGEIELRHGHGYLITANKGSKSQVSFSIDLKGTALKDLAGKRVGIRGTLNKTAPWGGKVTGAEVVGHAPARGFKVGSYHELKGTIENRQPRGIGSEAPPSGSYLVLDKPVMIAGKETGELFLQGGTRKNGAKLDLNGRIDVTTWGGVETHGSSIYSLSGISNLSAGEPAFDGKVFKNKGGEVLEQLSYMKPLVADIPARLIVLDPIDGKAFLGSMGGFIRPQMNGFHGFSGSAALAAPKPADRSAVKFNADGEPLNATSNKPLLLLKNEASQPGSDPMAASWYVDLEKNRAYQFVNGGIAGFHNEMEAVIKLA